MIYQKSQQLLNHIKKYQGFTLAEFFIAITIFSFISLTLIYALNISIKVYKQEANFDDSMSGIKLISAVMEKELQTAFVLNNIRLIGTAKKMYFYAPSAFPETDYSVNKITFTVIEGENEEVLLQRTSENPFLDELEEEQFSGFSYLYYPENNVKDIQFKYLSLQKEEGEEESSESQFIWQDSWDNEYFPDAVKLEYFFSYEQNENFYESVIVLPGTWNNLVEEEE